MLLPGPLSERPGQLADPSSSVGLDIGNHSAGAPVRKHSGWTGLVASIKHLAAFSSQAADRAVVEAGRVEVADLDHVECFGFA